MAITINDELLVRDIDTSVSKAKGAPSIHLRYKVDYRQCSAEDIMRWADESITIKRATPTRKLSQTEIVKLASDGRTGFDARNAGHAIVSIDQLITQTKAALAALPKEIRDEELAKFMKESK